MPVYPYRNQKVAWYRNPPFLVALIVAIVASCIYIWYSDPVNADSANTFWIVLRYVAFSLRTVFGILLTVLFLMTSFIYFISLIKRKNDPWHYSSAPYGRQKSRPLFLYADSFKRFSGVKGIVLGAFLSLLLFAFGILILLWMVLPSIQDIPYAITGHPTTFSAQVTDSYWIHSRHSSWNFDMAGQSFSTSWETLHAGEYASITFLPHSHFIIEYKHEKAE
ncbi:MAG: hypothetical protein ABF904_04720 [Ethanoligenens sp.]